jgi:hypothetical protein
MKEKRLVMIEQDGCVTYFKLNESQCDLLSYLYRNGYLESIDNIDFYANIEIVEL